MARCEDFPCCGHENGCCPDFDTSGKQLNMICTCGAKLPANAQYSICDSCMNGARDPYDDPFGYEDEYPDEYFDHDLEEEYPEDDRDFDPFFPNDL